MSEPRAFAHFYGGPLDGNQQEVEATSSDGAGPLVIVWAHPVFDVNTVITAGARATEVAMVEERYERDDRRPESTADFVHWNYRYARPKVPVQQA